MRRKRLRITAKRRAWKERIGDRKTKTRKHKLKKEEKVRRESKRG